MRSNGKFSRWWRSGEPFIWLNAVAVAISVVAVTGLIALLATRGLSHFWPSPILEVRYQPPGMPAVVLLGQVRETERVRRVQLEEAGVAGGNLPEEVERTLLQVGNRDISGEDFRWLLQPFTEETRLPDTAMVVERRAWGNLYGFLDPTESWDALQRNITRVEQLYSRIARLERHEIAAVNYRLEQLRLKERSIELGDIEQDKIPALQKEIAESKEVLAKTYEELSTELRALYRDAGRDSVKVRLADESVIDLPLEAVVRAYRPNQLNFVERLKVFAGRFWEFVADEPREANTEGGIFPAIFGTVLMVLLMTVLVTPFGILAAVYLREYARQGPLTRIVRICVNNLAGVPSIVYGVFGLGFFVYTLGGSLDQLFYRPSLPAPTFGTPGLFWASLTLALLTLPVVIVATEEGLARLPRSLREGSLALGATRLQTLVHVVLPTASPALITGLILAVARAAGEVAPLMLVGVVKLAPSLPVDGNFPYLHLERKFMHLGFHIYDVGYQSPNIEAAGPLVFATALLLVVVIVVLNLAAIRIRNRLRDRFRALES